MQKVLQKDEAKSKTGLNSCAVSAAVEQLFAVLFLTSRYFSGCRDDRELLLKEYAHSLVEAARLLSAEINGVSVL